ncbi:hypothetical protein Tco_0997520 [Tanacetum coccineum]
MADRNSSEQKRPDGNGSEQKTAGWEMTDLWVRGFYYGKGKMYKKGKGKGGPNGRLKSTAEELLCVLKAPAIRFQADAFEAFGAQGS